MAGGRFTSGPRHNSDAFCCQALPGRSMCGSNAAHGSALIGRLLDAVSPARGVVDESHHRQAQDDDTRPSLTRTPKAISDLSTDLIIHHPDPSNRPSEPLYSLIRLSATPTNQDWYQTNLPSQDKLPQWAERVRRATAREVPRVEALGGIDSGSDTDSEFDEPEVDMTMMPDEDRLSKAHPHRFRLWGMAASPGDGCVATLVSKHVTQHADRRPRSRVLFSWPRHDDDDDDAALAAASPVPPPPRSLTTEGTVWEAMYGNVVEIPTSLSKTTGRSLFQETSLRKQFKSVIPKQTCVFCNTRLVTLGNESTCEKGHSFGTSPFHSPPFSSCLENPTTNDQRQQQRVPPRVSPFSPRAYREYARYATFVA